VLVLRGDGRPCGAAKGTTDDRAVAATDFVADEGTKAATHGAAERRINALVARGRWRRRGQARKQDQ
jgi:hypothetical protein